MSKKLPSETSSKKALDPFSFFRDEMNRLFQEGAGPRWDGPRWEGPRWEGMLSRGGALSPLLDIKERDGGYEVSVEVPGVPEKELDISVANGVLTVSGEKREEKEEKGDKGYHVMERRYGSFTRSISLPEDVEESKIDATMTNGVLKITLPRSTKAKASKKKIPVKSGA